jgi:hypothetical protein
LELIHEIVIGKSSLYNIFVISIDLSHNRDARCATLSADAGIVFFLIVELNFTLHPRIGVLLSDEHPSENKHYF